MLRRRGHATGLVDQLQRSHRFTIGVLVTVLLVSLLSSGYLILVSEPRIGGYVELGREARDLHDSMLDQETGLRGWLATGEAAFLQPYRTGAADGRVAVRHLMGDVRQHPEVRRVVARTMLARRHWLDWTHTQLRLGPARRGSGDVASRLGSGRVFFDAYRAADTRTIDTIRGLRERAMARERATLLLDLSGYLTMVLVAGGLTLLRRRRLQHTVLDPVDDLHHTIAALQAGDLTARTRPTSVPELGEIGAELGRLAEHLARSAQESARLQAALREQAELDPLTGLLNRRRFEADLEAEWVRCRRYGRPLSLVMLDLDHFKVINDQHGHPVGDLTLRHTADAIRRALRSTDAGYRYGGEEFAVILPEAGLEDAELAAHRIRAAVASIVVPGHPSVTVSVSAGVSTRVSGTSHLAALVSAADQALYTAKRRGRDQVVSAPPMGSGDSPDSPESLESLVVQALD